MSAGAYEEEIREVGEEGFPPRTREAMTRAFMTCQEHNMHVTIASEMIWGIVEAMREGYRD